MLDRLMVLVSHLGFASLHIQNALHCDFSANRMLMLTPKCVQYNYRNLMVIECPDVSIHKKILFASKPITYDLFIYQLVRYTCSKWVLNSKSHSPLHCQKRKEMSFVLELIVFRTHQLLLHKFDENFAIDFSVMDLVQHLRTLKSTLTMLLLRIHSCVLMGRYWLKLVYIEKKYELNDLYTKTMLFSG